MSGERLLEIIGLKTHIYTPEGIVRAVDGIDFVVNLGETIGIIGESGCGKSMTALSILRLLPPQTNVSGKILYRGENLLEYSMPKMQDIRGGKISMIFQDPVTSLNPVFTVGDQICEAIILHQKINRQEAKEQAIEMLRLCGLPSPEEQFKRYPHQLSGGMNQRVMIAMALSTHPELLIADEPTTALDVTIQAQILELIQELQHRLNMAVILITHDLSIISSITERVIIMYAGKIIEYASTKEIFTNPVHPYTQGLITSIPTLKNKTTRLKTIPGTVPDHTNLPSGCRFHPRCPKVKPMCKDIEPEMKIVKEAHGIRCLL
jgi:peptide/nickel transport system ATP-binding protein/oligopeptide transport system ATP-binding protein